MMDLKESEILGNRPEEHWYYSSKALALQSLAKAIIPRTILDVGAGSAFFSEFLLRNSNATEGVCVDTAYPDDFDKIIAGKPLHFRRSIKQSDANLVLLMDVIEHIDDDTGFLREYKDRVPAGTVFVVSVPAFQFLWSTHDVFLEHKRRYTLRQLEGAITSAGLEVQTSSYFFGLVFPAALASRLLARLTESKTSKPRSQLKRHRWMINWILAMLCRLELLIFPKNKAFGLTAFCVARKP